MLGPLATGRGALLLERGVLMLVSCVYVGRGGQLAWMGRRGHISIPPAFIAKV